MGFLKKFRQSGAKSRLMKTAAQQVQAGQIDDAVSEVYDFLQGDETFRNILLTFHANKQDIKMIIGGLMMSGHGSEFRGHYVPVSAVLFHDTLAYLLRSKRGQLAVSEGEAHYQVHEYFRSGALVFEPERAFHRNA